MCQTLGCAGHVRAVVGQGQRRLRTAEHEIAAHPGGQVDHGVDVGGADHLDGATVQRDVAGALPRLGVPDVDVNDGRAGARRADRRLRDLLGRDRHQVRA